MQPTKVQITIGILAFLLILVLLYFIFVFIFRAIGSLDQPLIVAILAAAATVLASSIAVVIGRILERKKEIEAHFRQRKYEQYDELLKILYEMMEEGKVESGGDDIVKRLREWQRKLILFAGPSAIRSFVVWMSNLKQGKPTLNTFILMDDFFKALRADLGISNRGLDKGYFAHLILKDAEFVLALAKQNPQMSFEELVALEKAVGSAQSPTNTSA